MDQNQNAARALVRSGRPIPTAGASMTNLRAQVAGGRIEREPALRLLAPVAPNIVCFAYAGHDRSASDAVAAC
jgi:hypothetical protein